MWEKEEMRVSEAKGWQQGFTQTLWLTSREIPAKNMQQLTAVGYRFQEFLVTAVTKNSLREKVILSLFCIPLPPAAPSCNIKVGHAHNTDISQTSASSVICHLNTLSWWPKQSRGKISLGTKVLSAVSCEVHESHQLCTNANAVHFGEASLLENQQHMIQQVSRNDGFPTFHDSLI